MTSLAQIKQWSDRFPFDEGELEIILRCHASSTRGKNGGSFLNTLSHSFPYVFFFLPQDEMENRTSLVETYVLPEEFGRRFKSALCKHTANTEDADIESLIDGVANACRREPKDALGIIFDCCSHEEGLARPDNLVELCYRLSVASSILVSKQIDEIRVKSFCVPPLQGLKKSLTKLADKKDGNVTKVNFIAWGTKTVPYIYSCLPTFTHNLIFHGKSTKSHHEEAFVFPELLDNSEIFTSANPSLTFTIGCMAPKMGGKWRRLFTSEMEETPANCLQAAIGYHVGPSMFIIKLASGAIIGGCVEAKWKIGYFLFQLEPSASIYLTKSGKFSINHDEDYTTGAGELKGFGFYEDDDDATKWSTSHLFFSFPLDTCVASFLGDKPTKIDAFEVWGFGEELYDVL